MAGLGRATFPIVVNCSSCGKRKELWAYVMIAIRNVESAEQTVYYGCDCGTRVDISEEMLSFQHESKA